MGTKTPIRSAPLVLPDAWPVARSSCSPRCSARPPSPAPPPQPPPRATACRPPSWPADRADLAAQVVTLVNAHRAQLGLVPLVVSPTLTAAAEWKARNMAAYGYLDHDDPAPDARTANERVPPAATRRRSGARTSRPATPPPRPWSTPGWRPPSTGRTSSAPSTAPPASAPRAPPTVLGAVLRRRGRRGQRRLRARGADHGARDRRGALRRHRARVAHTARVRSAPCASPAPSGATASPAGCSAGAA